MKAISIWQPWAHLIAIGAKRFETRSWSTRYRGIVAIQAGKHWTQRISQQCYDEPFFSILSKAGTRFPAKLPSGPEVLGLCMGSIIAIADLVEVWPADELSPATGKAIGAHAIKLAVHERAFGDFSHGRFAWQCENVMRLPEPVLCRGQQGLFDLESDIIDRIMGQISGRKS